MALQAIGNVNLEFSNTGYTNTVSIVYTQNNITTWVSAEGLEGVNPSGPSAPDIDNYRVIPDYGSATVIDSNDNVILLYSQRKNSTNAHHKYIMLVKRDLKGNLIWRKEISHNGIIDPMFVKSMCLDANNDLYILADANGTKDVRIIKLTDKTPSQANLILNLDANNVLSYPGGNNGTVNSRVWYDTSDAKNNAQFITYGGALTHTFTDNGKFSFSTTAHAVIPTIRIRNKQFTFSIWIKTPAAGGLNGKPLLSYYDKRNLVQLQLSSFANDGKMYVNQAPIHNTVVADGKWHHVVAVFDETLNQVTGYVDGVQGITSAYGGKIKDSETKRMTIAAAPLALNGWSDNYYVGDISKVQVYDRALSAQEVSDLYNTWNPEAPRVVWAKNYSISSAAQVSNRSNGSYKIIEKNGKLYAVGKYYGIFCVDSSNGNVAWAQYSNGNDANTQLVYSTVLNGNVYAISESRHYHVHNFNANTGAWNDTKTFFTYQGNVQAYDGLGVVATDGYDLYVRQFETVTRVEGANTNNVIWCNRISHTGNGTALAFRSIWNDLVFDSKPVANSTGNSSANTFITVGFFNRADFGFRSPFFFQIDKDSAEIHTRRFTFGPWLIGDVYSSYWSKKPQVAYSNGVASIAVMSTTTYILFSFERAFNMFSDGNYQTNFRYGYDSDRSIDGIWMEFTGGVSTPLTKPDIRTFNYTWNPISITTTNYSTYTKNPDIIKYPFHNYNITYGNRMKQNPVQEWISDTRQSIGMDADIIINKPNNESYVSAFGANTGWPTGVGVDYYFNKDTQITSLETDSEGYPVTIGQITGFSENYTYYAVLTKWTKNGEVLWSRMISNINEQPYTNSFGGGYDAYAILVRVDKRDDSIYVITQQNVEIYYGAYFLSKFDKNGNFLWNKVLADELYVYDSSQNDISIDDEGNLYVVGQRPTVTSFTANGDYRWAITYSDTYYYNENGLGFVTAYDSNANILLVGESSWANVHAFDSSGNYKWTYTYTNENESSFGIQDVVIDDTQANTWYVIQYDGYGIDGLNGSAINKMQGYEDPQLVSRKYFYLKNPLDWQYETNSFNAPSTSGARFTKIIPKNNSLYLSGGIGRFDGDGGLRFYKFDKDLTTANFNNFFVDENSYTMYTFWWWNDNGSSTKEELFDIDVDGYMVRGGHWEPYQVMGDEVDGERNWSYDERGILVRLPSDGSLSHEWDYNKVNYPFGNIYNPKWRQFSYLAGDKIRARWNGELIPTANIGWFVTDTTNVYGKSTSQSDYFKKNVFFDDFGNLTYGPEDIILSNSNDFITITNTYESHFYNVTYHPITTGKFITLDYPYVPQTNTNTSSKLLDISSNVIQVNTVPLINANSTYKSWVHTSVRYDANVYTGGSSNYYGIYAPYYHFGTDAKIDNSNNIILIDQNSLHTNGNGVTVGITKFNEYGSKIWSYCFPASWEATDTFGQIDSLFSAGATIDENNNIYVMSERATSTAGLNKCIVAKLDPNGNLLWAKSYSDQGDYYANLRYINGVLLMVRSDNSFEARGPAVLYRLNPNNGDIIWAVNKNSSSPFSFHGINIHNNTILLGAEDGFYYAFDLNGNQLFARSLGGNYFGPSIFEIGDIASDGTDYYLADRVGWIHKIDGTTHNVKWSTLILLSYGAVYPRITYMNGYIHAHIPISGGQDDYPGVFYVKINPNNGEIVFSRYVALAPGPIRQAEYWQHYNPTWSFGADIKNNIYTFAGGLHLYDREPMGYRILLGKIDLTDTVLEERLYRFKPDYNDAFILNDTRNFSYSGGQNEIGGYYVYNQINGLDNNRVTFANVVTGAAHTFFSVNPATITVENLSGPLRVTPFEANGANLFVYSSRTDILSKPFVQTSNVSVNTNVSINFYGGLSINSYVRSTRSYDTDSWIASWGGYDHAVQKWVADYNYYEDYGAILDSRLVSMSVDSTGNVWSTGFFRGDQDYDNKPVILKHSANGNLISFYGTSATQTENIIPYYSATGYNITCDDNDNAYVSIYDDSYSTRPTDALQFAKISKDGNVLWKNCIEYPDALYGYVGPSYKLLVDSGANRLFCILLQNDQDLPGIICLNSATGNHLWTKTLNYQDYGGIYLADAVVLNGHLYALTYDALIKLDYDGNIVWSKSVPSGRLLSIDGTDLYLTEYYNNGIYSNVTKITKISGEKLESLDDFEGDWETTLKVTDLERLKYEENANSAYLYSNPEIHSVHYDHDKDKIIALGQANLLHSDWTFQQYYYYNYSKIYTFVWQIDPQTGELDHAIRVGNIYGDFIDYEHHNVYEWQTNGQISSFVKNGYVYSCGFLGGYEGFIPFPYSYSINNSNDDAAIVKFKYTGDKFITAQDTIDSIDTNDLIDGYDGTLDNLGEALFVTKAENTVISPSQHFANIANTNFTFSDFFVTNEYRIFSNTYTGGVIANSANVFIGSQYKANSSQYELPLYTPFHIKRADVINVNSLFVMYKGNVGVSENINAELNTRILSNTTNARDSLIQSSTYRERIIQATVPANGNVVIDLSIGNIFAYRRLQGSQTTNTINNIIIIQSGNVRNSNSLVQSFTLFTNGIGRIANSTWANANIAWPRFDVPRGPTGNSIYKYSFMKVPQSNLWYGFAQANTVNITFSKVKVLNAPANTSESITGTPIWGYDTPNGNNALIVKFNDATICGGSNTYSGVKQESTYTFSFESESELYLRSLNVASNVESGRDGYDRLKIVYTRIAFDGVTQTVIYEAFSQNTANILTCIGRSAYVNISPPYNLVLSSNTYHKFDLIANSVDALYHSDSQYNIQFDFRKRDN